MSISNRKPGERKESPAEPLKRSVAGCMRAVARRQDLEVTFASDRPALMGDKARLPEPPRKLGRQDVAILRGHADSMALRLACHDSAVHRRLAPEGQAARAVYDAVEQARVEAIGSRRMSGVAANLSAMLEDRYHRGGRYEEITDRADAPIEDALALMVRERLTGLKPPPAAAKLVDLWRDFIEERAGRDLDGLLRNIEHQRDYARGVRDLLSSLDMADDAPLDAEDEESDDENKETGPRSRSRRTPATSSRRAPPRPRTRRPATSPRMPRTPIRRNPRRPTGRRRAGRTSRAAPTTAPSRRSSTRSSRPRTSAIPTS
jgi:cobaltochelatase CobT